MTTRRFRRTTGLLPRLGNALWQGMRWLMRHPQPVVALALMLATGWWGWGAMTRSDAFRVTEIRLPPTSALRVPESLIGQNLWTVDLKGLADHLKAQQPHLKRVRVIRQPPNTIQIEVLERPVAAQLKLGQWHRVALDGFILPEAKSKPWDALTMLKGVDHPQAALAVGRENASPRLHGALRLVASLRRSPVLIGHQVTTVDVGDATQLTFVIDDRIEVRCGSEDELRTHLERLRAVLRLVVAQHLAVRYIDVRFSDPVIGPRT